MRGKRIQLNKTWLEKKDNNHNNPPSQICVNDKTMTEEKTLEDCLYTSDFNPSLGLQELHNQQESQDHPNTVNLRVHLIPAYQKQRNNKSATNLPFKDLYLIVSPHLLNTSQPAQTLGMSFPSVAVQEQCPGR